MESAGETGVAGIDQEGWTRKRKRGHTLAFVLHLGLEILKVWDMHSSDIHVGWLESGQQWKWPKQEIYLKGDHSALHRSVKEAGHFPSKEKVMAGRFWGVLDIGVFRKARKPI